jgi:Regulator of chromosome condensation (RCC1) repeat
VRLPHVLPAALLIIAAVALPAQAAPAAPNARASAGHALNSWGYYGGIIPSNAKAGGKFIGSLVPAQVPLPPKVRITQISSGQDDILALTSTGAVYSWGYNFDGELGIGQPGSEDLVTPTMVRFPSDTVITDVAAGDGHSLAVTSAGAVYGWGRNSVGELGPNAVGDDEISPTLIAEAPAAIAVAAGDDISFILTPSGSVYGFGGRSHGQTGIGQATDPTSTPTELTFPGAATITMIAAGEENGEAISTSGHLYSWGPDNEGGLGDGGSYDTEADTPAPVDLPSHTVVTAVSISGFGSSTDALTSTGTVYAWGLGRKGELGNGTTEAVSSTPVRAATPAGVRIIAINAGEVSSLAVSASGAVYGWGLGQEGELGNNSRTSHSTPVRIPMPHGARAYGVTSMIDTSYALVTPEPPPAIRPVINGLPRVGDLLACAASSPVPIGSTASWRWTAKGSTLATSQTFHIPASAHGKQLTCSLRLNDGYGTSSATSPAVTSIWATTLTNLKKPRLSGPHKVGATETVNHGVWSPNATSWQYRWYLGSSPIKGATASRLNILASFKGRVISCRVRADHHGDNPGQIRTEHVKIAS